MELEVDEGDAKYWYLFSLTVKIIPRRAQDLWQSYNTYSSAGCDENSQCLPTNNSIYYGGGEPSTMLNFLTSFEPASVSIATASAWWNTGIFLGTPNPGVAWRREVKR